MLLSDTPERNRVINGITIYMTNEDGVNEENSTPVANDQETENIETPVVEAEAAEAEESQEPAQEGAVDSTGDPKPEAEKTTPKHFREGYEALERDVKEKYKPIAEEVEALGGLDVVKALKPLAELALNENAEASEVVSVLKEFLLPSHMESVAWAALDNPATQEVVLNDPDVQAVISAKYFNGMSIEEVQSMLEVLGAEEEADPRLSEALKKVNSFENAQKQAAAQAEQAAASQRVQDLQKRFYVDTAEQVVKQFGLTAPEGASPEDKQLFEDTVEDVRFAAQGRFLKENSDAYLHIQEMYANGHVTQARVAEARLQNKWQATLIKTAERHSKQLQAMSASRKVEQQKKVANTRPDLSGNVPHDETKKADQYDLSDPNWLENFVKDFKRDAALA